MWRESMSYAGAMEHELPTGRGMLSTGDMEAGYVGDVMDGYRHGRGRVAGRGSTVRPTSLGTITCLAAGDTLPRRVSVLGLDSDVGGGTGDARAQLMCADWKRGELVRRHKDAKACDDTKTVAVTTVEMLETANKELWAVLKAHEAHCARVVAALDALYRAHPDVTKTLVLSPPSSPRPPTSTQSLRFWVIYGERPVLQSAPT